MINFDPLLETRILKTMLDDRALQWTSFINQEWFGQKYTREIINRVLNLKTHGKQVPRSELLATDPALSPEAQALLKGPTSPLTLDESEAAIARLDQLRKGRIIFSMCTQVVDICKENDPDLLKAENELRKGLTSLQTATFEDEFLSYGQGNDGVLDLYDAAMQKTLDEKFIRTGISAVDKQQGGLSRGRLYAIGAPSGGGKSVMANKIAISAYLQGHSVAYGSLELNREECMFRTQANISRIPHDKFQLKTLTSEEERISRSKLAKFLALGERNGNRLDYVCPKQDINLLQFFDMVEPLSIDVVAVDYLNLMKPINPKEGLWWNLGEGFRLAKRFAEKMQCVVLMLVQIDEETGDIKYAKSIKHHSDGVWVWKYDDKQRQGGMPVEVEQIKLRNFAPTKFTLMPEFEYCDFTEAYGAGAPSSNPGEATASPMKLG